MEPNLNVDLLESSVPQEIEPNPNTDASPEASPVASLNESPVPPQPESPSAPQTEVATPEFDPNQEHESSSLNQVSHEPDAAQVDVPEPSPLSVLLPSVELPQTEEPRQEAVEGNVQPEQENPLPVRSEIIDNVNDRMTQENPLPGEEGEDQSVILFVGSLPYEATEDDLHKLFSPFGQVLGVRIISDRVLNQPRGFAFIDMNSDEAAHNAIMSLNESEFKGRQISVSLSTPRDGSRAGGKMVSRGNAGRQGGTFSRGERGRSGVAPPARGSGGGRGGYSGGVDPVSGICRYYLQGNCTYGSKCGFPHGNIQGGRYDDMGPSNPGRVGIRGGMRGGGGGGRVGNFNQGWGNQGNMGQGNYGGGMGGMGMGNFGGMGQGNYMGGMGQGNFGGMQLPGNFGGLPTNFLNQGNLAALGSLLGTNFGGVPGGSGGNWGSGQGPPQQGNYGSGGNWSSGQF